MRNDYCSSYLEHSAKGKTWANHKYVAKVRLSSGKWFYFYDAKLYQNYLKRQSVGSSSNNSSGAPYAKKNPTAGLDKELAANPLRTYSKAKTVEEKKVATTQYINTGKAKSQELTKKAAATKASSEEAKALSEAGKKKTDEVLSKAKSTTDTSSSKSKSSGSSKKSGSSKSKSGSSGKKSSGSSKSSSKKEGSTKSNKESTGSKKSSSSDKKTTSEKATNNQTGSNTSSQTTNRQTKFTPESLKKLYGIKDKEVNKHETTEKLLEAIKSYVDGSFGYITAGDKVYKWSKQNGEIVFKDYDTDKEVTLPEALTDIQEFRTDKKKKKK